MIYIERVVTIRNNEALIDEQIILYKGDRNVEVQFTLKNNPFKDKNGVNIAYGQLIINRDNASSIFSDVSETIKGKVLFVITGDMIDELNECGDYDFQIRLFNEDKSSRVTLMPVMDGIAIREPLCEEAAASNTYVNSRRSIVTPAANDDDIFDIDGNYNRTTWVSGDIITDTKLNKVEEALYQINNSVPTDYTTERYVDLAIVDVEHYVDTSINMQESQLKEYMGETYSSKDYVDRAINSSVNTTMNYVDAAIANVELTPGPQGEPGPEGKQGPQGEPGKDGKDAEPVDLTGYATEDYVYNYTDQALIMIEEILCEGEVKSLINNILGEAK